MSNHGWVKSKQKLDPNQIDKDLAELNERYFHNQINIQPDIRRWTLTCPNLPVHPHDYIMLWFNTKNMKSIEFRHPHSEFMYWVSCVIRHALAAKYNGVITDESDNEKEHPDLEKYDTLEKWVEMRYSHHHDLAKEYIVGMFWAMVPPTFLGGKKVMSVKELTNKWNADHNPPPVTELEDNE